MKKICILTLALLVCFAMYACDKNDGKVETETMIVEVTDTDGNVVTDDEGNAVTEIIIVEVTESSEEGESSSESEESKENEVTAPREWTNFY